MDNTIAAAGLNPAIAISSAPQPAPRRSGSFQQILHSKVTSGNATESNRPSKAGDSGGNEVALRSSPANTRGKRASQRPAPKSAVQELAANTAPPVDGNPISTANPAALSTPPADVATSSDGELPGQEEASAIAELTDVSTASALSNAGASMSLAVPVGSQSGSALSAPTAFESGAPVEQPREKQMPIGNDTSALTAKVATAGLSAASDVVSDEIRATSAKLPSSSLDSIGKTGAQASLTAKDDVHSQSPPGDSGLSLPDSVNMDANARLASDASIHNPRSSATNSIAEPSTLATQPAADTSSAAVASASASTAQIAIERDPSSFANSSADLQTPPTTAIRTSADDGGAPLGLARPVSLPNGSTAPTRTAERNAPMFSASLRHARSQGDDAGSSDAGSSSQDPAMPAAMLRDGASPAAHQRSATTGVPVNGSPQEMATVPAATSPFASSDANSQNTATSPQSTSPMTQPNQEAAPSQPLIQTAHVLERMGQSEMHIGITAGSFGPVQLHATVSQDRFGASIFTSHEALHNAMAAEMPSLERAIAQHQLTLDTLRLDTRGDTNAGLAGDNRHSGSSQRQSSLPTGVRDLGDASETSSTEVSIFEMAADSRNSALNVHA